MTVEKAFGIIPLHKQGTFEWRVLLVHHQKGHWGFPKGHGKRGEKPHVSAERELLEETGLKVVHFLPHPEIKEHYKIDAEEKEITYFLAEAEGHVLPQLAEIQEAEWFTFAEAEERITFHEGKETCRKAQALVDKDLPRR